MISLLIGKHFKNTMVTSSGVGYQVNTKEEGSGEEKTLHIHTLVRENSITLYGFEEEVDKNLFLEMLSIDKIGPGTAFNILKNIETNEFKNLVASGDKKTLSQYKGVGPTTAEKLIKHFGDSPSMNVIGNDNILVEALLALGYDNKTAIQLYTANKDSKEWEFMSDEERLRMVISV